MSGLFAIAKLSEPFGNPRTLKVSISDHGELFYRMHNPKTRISFAISNLQVRIPLPDLRENTAQATLAEIRKALSSGVYTIQELKLAVPR